MKERRKSERFEMQLPARYKIANFPDSSYRGTVVNLGAEGVCLLSNMNLKNGTEIELQISLFDTEVVTIKTKVVWCKVLKKQRLFQAGVKIVDANSRQETKFIQFYCHHVLTPSQSDFAQEQLLWP